MQPNNSQKNDLENIDFNVKRNLVGFFDLLLKIDMRINTDLYKNKNKLTKDKYDWHNYY